ncbi:Mitochondrial zinc maintenance protein 1, mitochondrial [Scheffersomyces spartinae]|uniref:Mitochondrial zinc maintenance protein 1, mitochondrial n=1 Tax=Scheffersomyces spartinae TaxID=45513 RepID=A0A9P7VAP5_9ASCO|nr:Mitochondrial zinc maintenance protein 1, mitochondrial [Scheffersomyces spartinae]KAG7194275.1 Mitochondrial zinc maintenance protein 1, mitochondrial [Scheffersomyces spartinae]
MSALQAYRNALRATKVAFKKDVPVLTAARTKIREGFEEHRGLSDESLIQEEVTKLNGISQFLVRNVVQAKKQDNGKYLLDIHSETELGDNESIKNPKKDMGSLAGVKSCSGLKR